MEPLAIDVVLLPESKIAHDCIALNKRLVSESRSEIVLDYEACLPHVSLAMGCMTQEALPEIATRLQRIIQESSIEALRCQGIGTRVSSQGQPVSGLGLVATPTLQTLHERIMRDVAPLLSSEVTESMLHGDDPIAPSTLDWIRAYRESSSFDAFSPHITLGYGRLERTEFPSQFLARSLAVCHLGNHCTCRRILWETEISNQ
ncbi:MAG: 2'-5' RNA ligase family protein [Planctomycetes bacterium]|nr:2'-5' RNA ligase family protein [Planctomycetota bacterium]